MVKKLRSNIKMMLVEGFSRSAISFFDEVGLAVLFLKQNLVLLLQGRAKRTLVCEQIWRVTVQSSPTTALAGFFVGAIMAVQFTMQVKEFGALGYLGGLATSGTVREVGPLLIAFMLSGKIGAFTAAELGTMKVTEQIDAIRCLGANPLEEIVLPRLIGIVISSFFLLAMGLIMSLGGGIMVGLFFSGITPEEYIRHIPTILAVPSLLGGLFKCFVFALLLSVVCTFKGYTATGGAKGVGRAVIQTSVYSMVGMVIADWLTSFVGEGLLTFVMDLNL